jgi:hypothetical protein
MVILFLKYRNNVGVNYRLVPRLILHLAPFFGKQGTQSLGRLSRHFELMGFWC